MTTVSLPYNYTPRDYQLPRWQDFDSGMYKRYFDVWHRRGGKDLNWWNIVIREAGSGRVGLYYYFLPTAVQGRQVIWDGIDNTGRKFLDYIPKGLIKGMRIDEMKVEFTCGSIIRVIGTDNYDAVRGTNPIGCVFSEYAYQHPMAWQIVKPILNANGGWAAFNTTPNGNNHAKKLWDVARESEFWSTSLITIDDTNIVTQEMIDQDRAEGTPEEMIQQENYCSFEAGAVGAFYAINISQARSEGRVTNVPYDDSLPVDLFVDLGKSDTTAIGFVQRNGENVNIIDYYENNQKDIAHYVKVIKERKYRIRTLYLPHDAFAKRLESPQTIADQFEEHGFTIERVPNISIMNGIQLVRKIFPHLWFDKKTTLLIEALENYHKEYDVAKKVYKDTPVHDWSSHASDMARYMAVILTQKLTDISELERLHRDRMRPLQVDEDQLYLDRLDKAMKAIQNGEKPEDDYEVQRQEYLKTIERSTSNFY